jgi:hypothetical protein
MTTDLEALVVAAYVFADEYRVVAARRLSATLSWSRSRSGRRRSGSARTGSSRSGRADLAGLVPASAGAVAVQPAAARPGRHGGRIDTLGLDDDDNPVIVEYKRDRSESVINQGLFYLAWLIDPSRRLRACGTAPTWKRRTGVLGESTARASCVELHHVCQFKGGETIDDPSGKAYDIRSRAWGYPWAVNLSDAEDVDDVLRMLRAAYVYEQ